MAHIRGIRRKRNEVAREGRDDRKRKAAGADQTRTERKESGGRGTDIGAEIGEAMRKDDTEEGGEGQVIAAAVAAVVFWIVAAAIAVLLLRMHNIGNHKAMMTKEMKKHQAPSSCPSIFMGRYIHYNIVERI